VTRRLVASYVTVTLLVLVVFGVPLGVTYAHRQIGDVTSQLERDAFALASFAEDALDQGEPAPDLAATASAYAARTGSRVVIVDKSGNAIVDTDPTTPGATSFGTRPEITTALTGEVATGQRYSSTLGAGFVYVAVPVASGGEVHGAVRITYPTDTVDQRVRRYWLVLAGAGAISLAAVALVGFGLARWVTRPVRSLHASAAALGAGDLHARADEGRGPPEIRSLAAGFNAMADRIEELVAAQDAFVADASHQLRTPLTALRLRLETLEPDVATAGQDDLDAAMAEVSRLSRLVDGLLALARADRVQSPSTVVDVGAVLRDRRDAWEALAAERGVFLAADGIDFAVEARCTVDHLTQVVDNLLGNALDVSSAGMSVTLSVRHEGDTVAVHVVDQGPGLSPEARTRAFDRFWRASSGTVPGSLGGSGLGLAIAAKLVRVDGATIALETSDSGGVDAVVRYPAGA
jgi:signal transduction histidine kinase